MHEEVLDDSIAYLADPEPGAMAAGMTALLEDPGLRADLAARARAKVAAEFSPASFQTKLLSFYQRLPVAPGPSGRRKDAASPSGGRSTPGAA